MSGTSTVPVREKAARGRAARHPIPALLMAIVGVFGLDALLFRTPLYPPILEPDSSTGIFEMVLRRELQAQAANGDNMVVTLGDSRFAYSPKESNEVTAETGYVFRHAGVAGSDARAWYYMLRDLDPTASRYRAVVIGTPNYEDVDEAFNPFDDIRTLHYVVIRLRWTDILDFANAFESPALRFEALRGATLKGIVLQTDIQAFLTHPIKRLDYVALCRRGYEDWTYNFQETSRSMAGVQIDWKARKATFPPDADQEQHDTLNRTLDPAVPQTGRLAAYRKKWYGRIIDRYRGSRTKVIFVRLPRCPIHPPDDFFPKAGSVIREFAATVPNVRVADEHAFDSLERPENFKDGIHLNRAGIAEFSPMLAREIQKVLAR